MAQIQWDTGILIFYRVPASGDFSIPKATGVPPLNKSLKLTPFAPIVANAAA